MKSSRESGLDHITHEAEGHSAARGGGGEGEEREEEEERSSLVLLDRNASYPESLVAKTSLRIRPRLSRMRRVQSWEDGETHQTDRWVLTGRQTGRQKGQENNLNFLSCEQL